MTLFTRLGLAALTLGMPLMAYAAPASVTGIKASLESGKVRVTWQQATGDIASYRVFYSRASILGNGGLYDDFDTVEGSVNTHLLQNVPPSNELYVSVLAVDSKGEESPYFMEEAKVVLNGGAAASVARSSVAAVSSVAMSRAASVGAGSADGFRLLSAEAISSTGVVLRFSQTISIPANQALDAIVIENGSGQKLQLRRFIIENSTLTVHTEQQRGATVYRITVSQNVTATAPNGALLRIAADQTPTLFMGFGSASATSSVATAPTQKNDVTQLRLRAQVKDKKYSVEATWQAAAGAGITGYSVSQTTDGGRTYSTPRMLNASATAIKIDGVPSGSFGIMVKTVYADGTSRGVMQSINLPALSGGGQGGVITVPLPGGNGPSNLPSSGPALWLAIGGTGAAMGAWKTRNKKLAV